VAQKVVVQLTDDLDGKPIRDGGGETVTFALEGKSYEIDLSAENADRLRNALAQYVTAARKTGRASGRTSKGSSAPRERDYDPKQVRAWAESEGMQVSSRGRVPADLLIKFQAANPS